MHCVKINKSTLNKRSSVVFMPSDWPCTENMHRIHAKMFKIPSFSPITLYIILNLVVFLLREESERVLIIEDPVIYLSSSRAQFCGFRNFGKNAQSEFQCSISSLFPEQ